MRLTRIARSGVTALGLAMLTAGSAAAATPNDTLVVARILDNVPTMDPAEIAQGYVVQMMQSVCDSLLMRNTDDVTQLMPGIAESYDVSDDGLAITFKIKPGLTFPGTGNPVTAEDAAWSMKRILRLGKSASELQQWGFTADNAEQAIAAIDEGTLQVRLTQPYTPFPVLYSLFTDRAGMVLDRTEVLKHEVDGDMGNNWLRDNTACYGPYRLVLREPNNAVIFERNDDYGGEKPALARLFFRHVPESGAQRLLLEQGDVDVALDLNPTDAQGIEDHPETSVQRVLAPRFGYMALNQKHPILSNPKVREAFRYLVDYDSVAHDLMNGLVVPRNSLVPIGSVGALSEDEGSPFALDIERAKALIVEAGYPNGFSIELWTDTDPGKPEVAQHIQQNAVAAGIDMKVSIKTGNELGPRYNAREYEIVFVGWSAGYPDADAMLSRHAFNPDNSDEAKLIGFPAWRAAWQDQWFNEMVEKSRFEQDPDKRAEIVRQIQVRHMSEAPLIYVFQETVGLGQRDAVHGVALTPFAAVFRGATK
jgi:peptide/nickel transport system substrate-binding protein